MSVAERPQGACRQPRSRRAGQVTLLPALHYDEGLELAVLGAVLYKLVPIARLSLELFYVPAHQRLCAALQEAGDGATSDMLVESFLPAGDRGIADRARAVALISPPEVDPALARLSELVELRRKMTETVKTAESLGLHVVMPHERAAEVTDEIGGDGAPKQPKRRRKLAEQELWVPGHPDHFVTSKGIYRVTEEGDVAEVLACQLAEPKVLAEKDDEGRPVAMFYEFAVNGQQDVASGEELLNGALWGRLGVPGTGKRAIRDLLANAVLALADGKEPVPMLRRTGWYTREDGTRGFASAAGYDVLSGAELRFNPEAKLGEWAKRAQPPAAASDVEAQRQALCELVDLAPMSKGALVTLGAGARSFGYSLAPTATSVFLTGPGGRGKTSLGQVALMLMYDNRWPPRPTAHFSDTSYSHEMDLDAHGDVPTVVDDLPLTEDATEPEQAKVLTALEHLARPIGNDASAFRRRGARQGGRRPDYKARSVPIFPIESLPPKVNYTLLRRFCLVEVPEGDVRTAWKAERTDAWWPALRAVGKGIVGYLDGLGESASSWLDQHDQAWRDTLVQRVGTGNVRSWLPERAAPLVTGVELCELVTGLEPRTLTSPLVEALAEHLDRQARRIEDRMGSAADLVDALGELVRTALLERRAHVRSASTDTPEPVEADMTPEAQGLRLRFTTKEGLDEYEGQGVAFYPGKAGLFVRAGELRNLCRRSKDPRLSYFTERQMLAKLGAAGAVLESPYAAQRFSWVVKIAGNPLRLICVSRSVWPGEAPEEPGEPGTGEPPPAPASGQQPPTPAPTTPSGSRALAAELLGRIAQSPPSDVEAVRRYVAEHDWDADDLADWQMATLGRLLDALERGREPYDPQPEEEPKAQPKEPAVARRAPREPSARYRNMASDGRQVLIAGLPPVDVSAGITGMLDQARASADGHTPILWLHPSAEDALGKWPKTIEDYCRKLAKAGLDAEKSGDATVKVRAPGAPDVYMMLPRYGGMFYGLALPELLEAVELYREHVGLAYLYSASSTAVRLVTSWPHKGRLPAPSEPKLEPLPVQTAASVPRHMWRRPLSAEELAAGYVRAFDRNGTYLAAWMGLTVAAGGWHQIEGPVPVSAKAEPGWWLLDPGDLTALVPAYRPNPFERFNTTGPTWYTSELARVAVELAEAQGATLTAAGAWLASETGRYLDGPAGRLRDAKAALSADPRPAAQAAAAQVKDGYSGGTNWFQIKHRPSWRHSVLDRAVANTYRGLAATAPAPFAVAEIDTALFVVGEPEDVPAGLTVSSQLGKWKPKGRPVPVSEVREQLAAATDEGIWAVLDAVEPAPTISGEAGQ